MTSEVFNVNRYEADQGKVFDWRDLDAHKIVDEEGNEIQQHLNAKVLFISLPDSINNYVEVEVE